MDTNSTNNTTGLLFSGSLPNPKTTRKVKEQNDFQIIKETINYYINNAVFPNFDKERRLASGQLLTSDYDHILKQYKNAELTNYKGKVVNMPLIRPILNLLTGEKRKSPFNYYIKVNNSDTKKRFTQDLALKIRRRNEQELINKLNENGYNTGIDSKPTQSVEEVVSQHNRSWEDSRAIGGQIIIDDLVDNGDIKERFIEIYKKDWLETGAGYMFPFIQNGKVDFTREKPENVYVQYGNSVKAEDGEVVVRRMKCNLSTLVAMFGEELSEKKVKGKSALDWIVSAIKGAQKYTIPTKFQIASDVYMGIEKELSSVGSNYYNSLTTGELSMYYVAFKTLLKYYVLHYIDEMGQIRETEVDEEYKLNAAFKITKNEWEYMSEEDKSSIAMTYPNTDLYMEEHWTNTIYEGYMIPASYNIIRDKGFSVDDLYLRTRELPIQRDEINNNGYCKLPVIGRCDGMSIPSELEYYQYKYNLIHVVEERTLAKDKGQPLLFPIGLIPNIPGWGNTTGERLEHMLYYSDLLNVMFFDDSNERIMALAQTLKTVNMSTVEAIAKYIELKNQIKADAWDAIGMNRNRWGATFASEGKAKNEQDIIRSSMHTIDLNLTFNKIEESTLLAYLDYSKIAFVDGKTFTRYPRRDEYILSDEARYVYELDVDTHTETEYGLSVKPSDEEGEVLQLIQQLMLPYAQNGIAPDAVIGALRTKNPQVAQDYLKQAFEIQQQLQQQQQEQQSQAQQQLQQMQMQAEDKSNAFEKALVELKIHSQELIAMTQEETKRMNVNGKTNTTNINGNDTALKQEDTRIKEKKVDKDYDLGLKQIVSAEKIAKFNRNKTTSSTKK